MSDQIFGIKLVATDRGEGHLIHRSCLLGSGLWILTKLYLITILFILLGVWVTQRAPTPNFLKNQYWLCWVSFFSAALQTSTVWFVKFESIFGWLLCFWFLYVACQSFFTSCWFQSFQFVSFVCSRLSTVSVLTARSSSPLLLLFSPADWTQWVRRLLL